MQIESTLERLEMETTVQSLLLECCTERELMALCGLIVDQEYKLGAELVVAWRLLARKYRRVWLARRFGHAMGFVAEAMNTRIEDLTDEQMGWVRDGHALRVTAWKQKRLIDRECDATTTDSSTSTP